MTGFLTLALLLLLAPWSAASAGSARFVTALEGDHWVYVPDGGADRILLVAHGMHKPAQRTSDVAHTFLQRWMHYAEQHRLIVIAPVFDDDRFAVLSGGYGGYRGLFGRELGADSFVNRLVDRYAGTTTSRSHQFYLYGHSAGGQFAARYLVTHPDRVLRAALSAPGRYSYPDSSVAWPYGAGTLSRQVEWSGGHKRTEVVRKDLAMYARAATVPIAIVIGSNDVSRQPPRPAHMGSDRVAYAYAWARAMNKHALASGLKGSIAVIEVEGVGHSSAPLTGHAAEFLFGH